jgi:hypothetical protein
VSSGGFDSTGVLAVQVGFFVCFLVVVAVAIVGAAVSAIRRILATVTGDDGRE